MRSYENKMKTLKNQRNTNIRLSNNHAGIRSIKQFGNLQLEVLFFGILFAAIIPAHHYLPCITQLYSSEEEIMILKTWAKLNHNCFLPSKAMIMQFDFSFYKEKIPEISKSLKETAQSTLVQVFEAFKIIFPVDIECMNMFFYPFAIFLPPIALFFIILSGMNADNNGATATLERRGARKNRKCRSGSSLLVRPLSMSRQSKKSQFVLCATWLFLFLAAMISSAKSGHMIVLGLTSGITPIMLIVMTWFSVSNAEFLHCGVCFDEVDAEQWDCEQRLVQGDILSCAFPSATSQVEASLCKIAYENFAPLFQ
mmetsp:Transcript_8635/g.18545  ORF Transcript_8635/g.18545 Transcript_8635/m.18545 type:complete len:311 (+) Transcript_8635:97-1029(+)